MLRKMVVLMMVVFSASAMAFGLSDVKSAASGDDEGTKKASKNFVDAVSNLGSAQAKFADALGLKEVADKANATVKQLKSGNVSSSVVKDATSNTKANDDAINAAMAKAKPLDAAAKSKFMEGMVPYSIGMTNTVLLVKNAKDIRGVGTGLAIAKSAPDLLKSVGSTSKNIISFAKTNNIDASKLASVDFGM